MNFLVDENLPPALAARLSELGHDAIHVKDAGLIGANDAAIAAAARREDRVILTRDADFRMIGADPGGVQVLRLGMGNANNAALLQWIAPRLPDAVRRFAQGERFVELLSAVECVLFLRRVAGLGLFAPGHRHVARRIGGRR